MKPMGWTWILAAALAACLGCGSGGNHPALGRVAGLVTLDGQSVPGASVVFEPQGAGAASNGLTDSSGRYELWYTDGVKGAALGSHSVRIETQPNPDPQTGQIPPQLPARYSGGGALSASVQAGDNTINFELER